MEFHYDHLYYHKKLNLRNLPLNHSNQAQGRYHKFQYNFEYRIRAHQMDIMERNREVYKT